MTDKDIIDLDQANGVFARFAADSAYQDNPVYDAASRHFSVPLPEVMIPRRSTAVLSPHAEDEQTDLDFHIIELGARERIAGQKARNGDKSNLSINFTATPN
jgi:hypothetical protein